MARSVLQLTTAAMGVGKTYMRGAVFVATEWLPYQKGLHVSNMPLNAKAIAAYCKRRYGSDFDAEKRIVRLPAEVVTEWMQDDPKPKPDGWEAPGPWDVLGPGKMWPLNGTHVAIDEAHLFVPRSKQLEKRKRWRKWVMEIRHSGATVELLTQNFQMLDEDLRNVAEVRYTLVSRASDRDPFLKIPMSDWYELKGKLTGEWNPVICQHEKRKTDTGWEPLEEKRVELSKRFYSLYDSYSKPLTEDGGAVSHEVKAEHEFEKRGVFSLLWWFWRRHWYRFAGVAFALSVLGWLLLGGGLPVLISWLMAFIQGFAAKQHGGAVAEAVTEGQGAASVVVDGQGVAVPKVPEGHLEVPLDMVIFRVGEGEDSETITVGDYQDIVEDRLWLEQQNQVQASELKKWRAESDELVMITPTSATFSSGERVEVGAEIQRSGHYGTRLLSVDVKGRRVRLSTGEWVALRVPDLVSAGGLSRLSGGGGGDASPGSGSGRPGPGRYGRQSGGRQSPGGPGLPGNQSAGGRVDSVGGEPGREAGELGS